ncbi:hypothetical protein FOA52_004893 [Chlamydomonas sp. UWO 241]|nr:hypothetical protein FOA52_004893 [Chlamydomonas sp. UWO 241]
MRTPAQYQHALTPRVVPGQCGVDVWHAAQWHPHAQRAAHRVGQQHTCLAVSQREQQVLATEQPTPGTSPRPSASTAPPAERGVRIRMHNTTYIDMGRSEFWRLLQDLVPPGQWPATAVVLACLESVYKAEYAKVAEEAQAALFAADAAQTAADAMPLELGEGEERLTRLGQAAQGVWLGAKRSAQRLVRAFSNSDGGAGQAGRSEGSGAASGTSGSDGGSNGAGTAGSDGEGGGAAAAAAATAAAMAAATATTAAAAAAAGAAAAAAELAADAARRGDGPPRWLARTATTSSGEGCGFWDSSSVDDDSAGGSTGGADYCGGDAAGGSGGGGSGGNGDGSGSGSGGGGRPSTSPRSAAEHAQLQDAAFLSLLSTLVRSSHFWPLSRRDTEIAKSLNADYLQQLFILGSSRTLDEGLVSGFSGVARTHWMDGLQTQDGGAAASHAHAGQERGAGPPRAGPPRARLGAPPGLTSRCWEGMYSAEHTLAESSERAAPAPAPRAEGAGAARTTAAAAAAPAGRRGGVRAAARASSLPFAPSPETQGVLVFKRGHTQESQTGRLVVTKLDALQAMLAGGTANFVASMFSALWDIASDVSSRGWMRMLQQQGEEEDGKPPATGSFPLLQQGGAPAPAGGLLRDAEQPWLDVTPGGGGVSEEVEAGVEEIVGVVSERLSERADQATRTALSRLSSLWASFVRGVSDVGLIPRLDVLTLAEVERRYPVVEPTGLPPKYVSKVSLEDVLDLGVQRGLGELLRLLLAQVTLNEPAFSEMVVVYRTVPPPRPARTPSAVRRVLGLARGGGEPPVVVGGGGREAAAGRRGRPIQLRVYRDIPLPNWKVLLPDKLLQFRPLDLVRNDVFAIAGLVAVLAQARYESVVLEAVTIVSASAALVRVVLGYQRMGDRYRSYVNDVLQQRTVASQEGAVDFLASAAATQQFKQASLAYTLLLSRRPFSADLPDGTSDGATGGSSWEQQQPGTSNGSGSGGGGSGGSGSGGGGDAGAVPLEGAAEGTAESTAGSATGGSSREQLQRDTSSGNGSGGGGGGSGGVGPGPQEGVTEGSSERQQPHTSGSSGSTASCGGGADGGWAPRGFVSVGELCARFDADEAVGELARLGLVDARLATFGARSDDGAYLVDARGGPDALPDGADGSGGGSGAHVVVRAVGVPEGTRVAQDHWDALLWHRVDGVLREFCVRERLQG